MDEQNTGYFNEALSNFAFDVAGGAAIRHMADAGYDVDRIMRELDYPIPRARVEKELNRYLQEKEAKRGQTYERDK